MVLNFKQVFRVLKYYVGALKIEDTPGLGKSRKKLFVSWITDHEEENDPNNSFRIINKS